MHFSHDLGWMCL